MKPSYIVWRHVKWYSLFGKRVWHFFKELNIELPYDPAIPLLGILTQEKWKHRFTQTHTHTHCIGMFIAQCAVLCLVLSCVLLFVTSCTVAHQAPLSMWFSRQEYWSGLPCPPPGDLPNSGIEPRSPALQADSLLSDPPGKPKNIGVGSLSLLQEIFPTWESNWGLLHYRQILYQLSYQGSPHSTIWSSNSTPRYILKRNENGFTHTHNTYTHTNCIGICIETLTKGGNNIYVHQQENGHIKCGIDIQWNIIWQ